MKNKFVYRHIRNDKNVPFYIGIGTHNTKSNNQLWKYCRAYNKCNRNPIWKKIKNKTTYKVEILVDNLNHIEANNKEIEFIKLYGRIDLKTGTLANLTNGGDGCQGHIISENQKKKISQSLTGRKYSEEFKLKLSLAHKGKYTGKDHPMYGKTHTQTTKAKISKTKTGKNKGKNNSRSKEVIDVQTGIVYPCLKEVSNILNIKNQTLSAKLISGKTGKYNNTTFIYLEDYLPYKIEKV